MRMFWSRWATVNSPVWNQLQDLQGEVNRLFDAWGDRGHRFLGTPSFPAFNVWENDNDLYVESELPGMELDDLEIYVTGHNQLTIKGERKPPQLGKGVYHRQERGFGTFVRTLTLPVPVDENKIDARFENGVLKLHMPKHEAAKPRKIEVKA
jgi:HSP20 family protein